MGLLILVIINTVYAWITSPNLSPPRYKAEFASAPAAV